MRVALALLALTGCSQIFGLADPVRQTRDDAPLPDVAGDTGASTDSAVVPPGTCDPSVPALIACYDFEGNTLDGSSTGNHAAAANVTYAQGPRGAAIHVEVTSRVTPPTTSVFNVTSVSVMAWVRLDSLPASGARAGVFDADARYAIFVHGDGSFTCRNGVSATGLLQAAQWHHLAITDDGVTLLLYLNGTQVASIASTAVPMSAGTVEIGGNAPTGDRLIGSIDSLRVYRGVRTPAEILDEASP